MSMTGVLVNTGTILVGSAVGLLFKKGIPERVTNAVMIGLGLCALYIGIDGALQDENVLIVIASMVLGAIVGTLLDIDGAINRLVKWIEGKFQKQEGGKVSVAEGFVTASLLFTKSMLDLFASIMLTASLGFGVMLSAVFVLVFQGALVLLAGVLAPVLTPLAIAEMTSAGSLIIVAIATNLIGITKIKVADYLPAIVFAPIICWIVSLF